MSPRPGSGIQIRGPLPDTYKEILTDEALQLLADLHRKFDGRRRELLARRVERQREIDAGKLPDFLPETANIRNAEWTVAPIPADLQDRRTEITGPVDRKMIINALNAEPASSWPTSRTPTPRHGPTASKASATSGTRSIRRSRFEQPGGKEYKLNDEDAVLLVRPRGWHLTEKHVLVDGEPHLSVPVRFRALLLPQREATWLNGSGPYFYLPKLESHLEARLWNDVFNFTQDASVSRAAPFARQCSSKPSSAPSRWTRSYTNCAITPPA